jgi:septum formation protein
MFSLILASQSPARLKTLRAAGVEPTVVVSDVDEDAALDAARASYPDLEPVDAVLVLAKAKAEAVAMAVAASSLPLTAPITGAEQAVTHGMEALSVGYSLFGDVVVGCDSMLEIDGVIRSKPADAAEAIANLKQQRGRTGTLHTGHWLIDIRDPQDGGTGATLGATSSTVIHFADIDDDEIEAYVATGEPLHVAGCFTIDGLGGPYVDRIEGDHHGVVGLSLPLLRSLLADIGVPWRSMRAR